MLTKNKIISSLNNLPERFTIDEFIDYLLFVEKVETGIKQSQEGKTYTKKEAKEKLGKWLK